MSYKLLILEDNTLLLQTLEDFLSEYAYACTLVKSGKEALEACFQNTFDLYLVDVKVPDMSGFEFLQALRHSGDRTPAIFITSLNDQESVAKGFLAGGDDYIKKPFDLHELLLRIKAILARTKGIVDDWLIIDNDYKLNLARKRLFKGTTELDLNLKDFELLYLLVKDRGHVVTKEMIHQHLWSSSEEINEGSIRVYINNLKKIFGKEAIVNIRGIGYRFEK
ncbi:response regulator transcription factor [Sulfurospirillum barnesii]|uniref:Response regulator with CheY-like receiver domain and winged-helix DNA-binding domain n=1 Tax=Sulfurospirillum barnesii (strain ATCC 700032 / DSM 10660 / SES-3) TaxID=760154 RepID=I3XU43_SULBS|nr:response regulator transcription factor [Sulfurospirillum barnesii]AFL67467.1 response regulator with CheY-like receiver domain and winged-helix DNA-binding domain [Sulfurospirillum barnesii SES-3]